METKICSNCKIEKPLTEFTKSRNKSLPNCKKCRCEISKLYNLKNKEKRNIYSKQYREKNKDKIKEKRSKIYCQEYRKINRDKINLYAKNYYISNKESQKNSQLKSRFNITLEEYNKMFQKQNGVCAICGKNEEIKGRSLAVDHNHQIGKVRGLLCGKCNKMLGLSNDNIIILESAINYIKGFLNGIS
jgi:hypothetical protein